MAVVCGARMLCVCTRRRRGGRGPPEILIIRGAAAQTVRPAQRRLRGEVLRVVEVRGQAVRVHRWVAVLWKPVSFWKGQTVDVRKTGLLVEQFLKNDELFLG